VPNGLLPTSILGILGQCIANNAYLHTEFLRWISVQALPYTCTDEYLDAWASLKGCLRYPAAASVATATFAGTTGTIIPSGTILTRTGDNILFQTTLPGTLTSPGTATIPVQASTPGSNTNGVSGLAASLTTPILNVTSTVTLSAATGGSAQETDADLRTRMLLAFAAVGSAGSISNFKAWASETSGVTRTWISPWGFGIGTVLVFVMFDNVNATTNNGFPLGTAGVATAETRWPTIATGDCLATANTIFPLQPISSLVFVTGPVPQHIAVNITGLSIAVTSTVQANLLAALQVYLLTVGSPLTCTVYQSGLEATIQAAVGSGVTFTLASPVANIVCSNGYLPTIVASDITVT
jgi:uncharacterized phage protein gp47/JayE